MALPTSGTYTGLYVYQLVGSSNLPDPVQQALSELTPLLAGSGLAVPTTFIVPIASGTDVTFDGSSLSFATDNNGPLTLDDTVTYAQSESTFGVTSGGAQFVVSNAAMTDTMSGDTALDDLASFYLGEGNQAAANTVEQVKQIVDNYGLGGLSFITDAGVFDGQPYQAPCFARGTLIRTVQGDVPVERIRAGDTIVLARGGAAPVLQVNRRRARIDATALDPQFPIRVTAGAFGDGLPVRDLVVSPDHALFLDGVLVPAGLLVDGDRIREDRVETVDYFHVELASHDVLLAEGAPAETYLDTGNRQAFSNASFVRIGAATPASDRVGRACADMVLGGATLDAIRDRLASVVVNATRRHAA